MSLNDAVPVEHVMETQKRSYRPAFSPIASDSPSGNRSPRCGAPNLLSDGNSTDVRRSDLRHEWERAKSGGVTTIEFPRVVQKRITPSEMNFSKSGSVNGGSFSSNTGISDRGEGDNGGGADDGGDGEKKRLVPPPAEEPVHVDPNAHKLDQFRATAIAGNDITSSCLYAAGITMTAAGIAAPISALLIVVVLYVFRGIYSEVCSGLPLNGGTYNALLNTTAKWVAALASVLCLVSYTATAVTSAASAGAYVHSEWDVVPAKWLAIGIILFFCVLNLFGISESATSAGVLFAGHLLTMAVLIITALIFVIRDGGETMKANFHSSSPNANPHGNWAANIWNGYCSALLGVTGFETSSNYIEEQRPGVFPKTLRNMWILVSLLNPSLVLLAMGVLPIDDVVADANFSLASMANISGGEWLKIWVVVDAALVLSGSVLTSYVGIGGLMKRMAYDQLLPSFFTQTNKWRGSPHWIVLGFCGLCTSLRLLVDDMETLGGVYAIAFLGVMSLFAVANLALKAKRGGLKRTPIVPVPVVLTGLCFVVSGMMGNFVRSGKNAEFFFIYFAAFSVVVVACIWRIPFLRAMAALASKVSTRLAVWIRSRISDIRHQKVMFFTKTSNAARLNKVISYVVDNEDTTNIIVIHCLGTDPIVDEESTRFATSLEDSCAILDNLYPKLTIELVFVNADFSPETLTVLGKELGVEKNFMFITCPSDSFPHDMASFGGLRVITY